MWGAMKIPDLENTGKDEREDHKSMAKSRCVIRSQMKGKTHIQIEEPHSTPDRQYQERKIPVYHS